MRNRTSLPRPATMSIRPSRLKSAAATLPAVPGMLRGKTVEATVVASVEDRQEAAAGVGNDEIGPRIVVEEDRFADAGIARIGRMVDGDRRRLRAGRSHRVGGEVSAVVAQYDDAVRLDDEQVDIAVGLHVDRTDRPRCGSDRVLRGGHHLRSGVEHRRRHRQRHAGLELALHRGGIEDDVHLVVGRIGDRDVGAAVAVERRGGDAGELLAAPCRWQRP